MADKFIDLGRESEMAGCCASPSSDEGAHVYYPSLYISGVEGLDINTGEVTFTAKGKVISVSHRETEDDGEKWSYEIEVHAIKLPGLREEVDEEDEGADSKLGKALDDISGKKK